MSKIIDTLIPVDNDYKSFLSGVDANGNAVPLAVDASGHLLVSQSSGSDLYDYKQFTLGALTADYNVATNQTDLFDDVPTAGYVKIITNNTISVRFNSNTNKSIIITSSESPAEFRIKTTNLFIDSTPGATVSIFLQP